MCNLILDRYISGNDINDPNVRKNCGMIASLTGIIINIILFAGKFIAGTLFGSISITADAINNLSDAGSSVISLVSFKISSKPADRDHPFGHERFEYVASMIVSFVILVIGFELLTASINKIIHPQELEFSYLAVIVLSVSIVLKLWLYFFYRSVSRKITSAVMSASSADSLSDVFTTSAVLIAVLIMKFTGINIDGYIGVAVAIFIFISGMKILNENKNHILGTAPSADMVSKLVSEAKSHPEVLGIHDLVVHNYGPGRCFASFHAEVDGRENVFASHDIIDDIEKDIYAKYGVQCVIHMDPIETDNDLVNELRDDVEEIVSAIDDRLSIHDFRFVPGVTHTNLIFDVVIPYEEKLTTEELKSIINAKIKNISPSYRTVITFDKG